MAYRRLAAAGLVLCLPAFVALADHHESKEMENAKDKMDSAEAQAKDAQTEGSEQVLGGGEDPVRKSITPQALSEYDSDGNGALSKEEVAGTGLESQFASMDLNGDGSLSKIELIEASGVGGPETGSGSSDSSMEGSESGTSSSSGGH